MPSNNVLGNLFATIFNNEVRNKKECLAIPASKLASSVLRSMQKNRYIGEFEFIDDGIAGKFKIQLLGRINRCGVISPRYSVKKDGYTRWERQFLPAVGVGILIVSTPQGVMSHSEAQDKGLGGRLVGYVY
ncbi:MAG TPA: 30S ribosomal protein S8 [Nitrososphaerales archaeon]|nr:30S ribosomal protein S8 [Nitrososphaerales archaeon]